MKFRNIHQFSWQTIFIIALIAFVNISRAQERILLRGQINEFTRKKTSLIIIRSYERDEIMALLADNSKDSSKESATINKLFSLQEDTINNNSDFSDINFNCETKIKQSLFNNADFSSCHFGETALNPNMYNINFEENKFSKRIDFGSSIFYMPVSFSGSEFSDTVNFKGTKFKLRLTLKQIKTNSSTHFNFYSSVLPDYIDFSDNPYLSCKVDFRYIDSDRKNSTKKYLLNLFNTDVSKFEMDYSSFQLYFDDYVTTNQRKNVYELLLKHFEDSGQTTNFEALNGEYTEFKIEHSNAIDWSYEIITSSPTSLVIFTLITLSFISTINLAVYEQLNEHVFCIEHFDRDSSVGRSANWFVRIGCHIFYGVVYTSIIYFSFRLEIGKLRFYKIRLLLWFAIIYVTGCINVFLIANLILKK